MKTKQLIRSEIFRAVCI